jgi:hypothetical protein
MPIPIFVSYSHQDAGLVQLVVKLLRATEDVVFQDLDSIKPGRKWRREIEEALHAAQLFVLFWCYHASRSKEVKKEYELAVTTGKDVLPVLLDTTSLPEQLNDFQCIDFRLLVSSQHRSYKHWVTRAVILVVLTLMLWSCLLLLFLLSLLWPIPIPLPAMTVTSVYTLALVALVIWIVRTTYLRARAYPTDYQQQMAVEIQTELYRRGIDSTENTA